MSKLVSFLRDSKEEMVERVTWSKYSELQSTSMVVLVASMMFALLIGAMDWGFNEVVKIIYQSF